MNFWNEKRLFQELPFYNVLIEKPHIKHLSNRDLLHELPFYDELSILQISKAFKGYEKSYKIEIIDSKDPLAQLEASKSSIKDLLKDLLDNIKGFKYKFNSKSFVKQMQRKWKGKLLFILILLLKQ